MTAPHGTEPGTENDNPRFLYGAHAVLLFPEEHQGRVRYRRLPIVSFDPSVLVPPPKRNLVVRLWHWFSYWTWPVIGWLWHWYIQLYRIPEVPVLADGPGVHRYTIQAGNEYGVSAPLHCQSVDPIYPQVIKPRRRVTYYRVFVLRLDGTLNFRFNSTPACIETERPKQ